LEDGRLVLQRVTPSTLIMQFSSTYKNIYELSNKLIDNGLNILAMLLIGRLCKDATNSSSIKKALVKSVYLDKLKNIVSKSI
jgi:hypothetical protein